MTGFSDEAVVASGDDDDDDDSDDDVDTAGAVGAGVSVGGSLGRIRFVPTISIASRFHRFRRSIKTADFSFGSSSSLSNSISSDCVIRCGPSSWSDVCCKSLLVLVVVVLCSVPVLATVLSVDCCAFGC